MFLGLINPVLKLKSRELDVLATLIKVYYGNKHVPVEAVHKIIDTPKVRKAVQELLSMNNNHYNYTLFQLRKKKALNSDGTVPDGLLKSFPKDKQGEVKFVLKITDGVL